jgi:hypothetical protein
VAIIDDLFTACRLANLNVVPPTLESIVEKILAGNGVEEVEGAPALRAAAG